MTSTSKLGYIKNWQVNNPEKVKANQLRWRLSNPEKVCKTRYNWRKTNPIRAQVSALVEAAKRRSREQKVPFDVDLMSRAAIETRMLALPFCECCRVDLAIGSNKKAKANSPSIDKINPSLGYVDGNVAILCFRCNTIKQNATADELLCIGSWLKERQCS